jgi:hypothetical protein
MIPFSTLQKVLLVAFALGALLTFNACYTSKKKPRDVHGINMLSIEEMFKQADKNGDGKVSRNECTYFLITEAFAIYDPQGQGYVTLAQREAGGGSAADFRRIAKAGCGSLYARRCQSQPNFA